MKDELGEKIMKQFVWLRAKTYSYLIDDDSEDKKAQGTKKCVIKRNIKCEDYKNRLEAAQLVNKINHLEKNKIDVDSLEIVHKEFITNNKLILKTQQRFRSENHNVFTEKINTIAWSSNDDKRIQSIDSTEIYEFGNSKNLICK